MHGELINPDTGDYFNEKDNWNPESCVLNREFFKHLGNLSYTELKRLAEQLLNDSGEKRIWAYPKVTMLW